MKNVKVMINLINTHGIWKLLQAKVKLYLDVTNFHHSLNWNILLQPI